MKKNKTLGINKPWEAYVVLAPWIIGFLCFTLIPMVMSGYYSFTNYDLGNPPQFIGLDNYRNMLTDARMQKSLQVTTRYVFISIPFQLSFALFLAMVFRKDIKFVRFYRAVYYLPSLFGGSVAVALLWRQIFSRDGIVNRLLALVGIEGRSWIASPDTALYTLIILAVWQFGSSMVIFLAGLKQIPTDLYEAAEIDGAGKVRMFFKVTLPLLTPIVFFNVVMTIINAFQAFTPSYIISGGSGSPLDNTLFYTLYLYIVGFNRFSMGYASALAWVLLFIIATITAFMFAFSRKWVFYNE